jgi:tripartite-type tricarboxylate transporter receptor subunit TctC
MLSRRKFAGALLGVAVALGASLPAAAQSFPNKPMRLLVGYGAGGVTDIVARLAADEVGKRLGQPMVVENRPGAAGLVAAQAVKNAAPDGYTLFSGSVGEFHPIYMKASLDASKELTPIGHYGFGDWFLYVPTSIKVNNLKDLQAYAKANPGKVRFAGLATTNLMLFSVVAKRLGFTFENVSYKTGDQTRLALMQGDAQATFNAASGFDADIQSGKIKAIATLSAARSPVRPDVPTAKEQGLDLELRFNQGMWGPPGLPADVTAKIGAAIREAIKSPAVSEKLRNAALVPTASTPQEMLKIFENEINFYKEGIVASGYEPQ